jgi:hypothetical protein
MFIIEAFTCNNSTQIASHIVILSHAYASGGGGGARVAAFTTPANCDRRATVGNKTNATSSLKSPLLRLYKTYMQQINDFVCQPYAKFIIISINRCG